MHLDTFNQVSAVRENDASSDAAEVTAVIHNPRKNTHTHLHQLEGKTLVKYTVDLRTTGQVGRVHLISRPLDALLKVQGELLHHPAHQAQRPQQGLKLTDG